MQNLNLCSVISSQIIFIKENEKGTTVRKVIGKGKDRLNTCLKKSRKERKTLNWERNLRNS